MPNNNVCILIGCDTCEWFKEYPRLPIHFGGEIATTNNGYCKQHLKEVESYNSCKLWQSKQVYGFGFSATTLPDGWEEK